MKAILIYYFQSITKGRNFHILLRPRTSCMLWFTSVSRKTNLIHFFQNFYWIVGSTILLRFEFNFKRLTLSLKGKFLWWKVLLVGKFQSKKFYQHFFVVSRKKFKKINVIKLFINIFIFYLFSFLLLFWISLLIVAIIVPFVLSFQNISTLSRTITFLRNLKISW